MQIDVCVCVCVCSWSAALDEPWVKTDVSDVMSVQQPGEETLQTQTITTVRTRAVLSLKKHKRGEEGRERGRQREEKQIMISSLLQTIFKQWFLGQSENNILSLTHTVNN